MEPLAGRPEAGLSTPKALAFYLPQFHPIPENDQWWGKGFTEWMNVTKARPLFPGHYQPHVPGELGYYDLRLPEVRAAQADLARAHGVHGFIYYHYWFHGRRLLERPFNEVLESGSPDFPFALCWANGEWTRNWMGEGSVLIAQEYSAADDLAHIRSLLGAFADHRYITIDGRPLMLVYRPRDLPEPNRTTDLWRKEAVEAGFPDLYLAWVEGWGEPPGGPEAHGFDATVAFMPPHGPRSFMPLETTRTHRILDYEAAGDLQLARPAVPWKRFPAVMVGWDNTARRARAATIFEGATPEAYGEWLRRTAHSVADVRDEENYLFILAWNEWAEGNHLEPDQRFGRAFLEATRSVLSGGAAADRQAADRQAAGPPEGSVRTDGNGGGSRDTEAAGTAAHAARLVRTLGLGSSLVVELGAGDGTVQRDLDPHGIDYHALGAGPEVVGRLEASGISATQWDPEDVEATLLALDGLGEIGCLLLLDALGTLSEPERFLSRLSAWALERGRPLLVLSAPNVGTFEVGMNALCGRWIPDVSGGPPQHRVTGPVLHRLLERCGWTLVAEEDVESMAPDPVTALVQDAVPEELVGALRLLSRTFNPTATTRRFVWALRPVRVEHPPRTWQEAVGGADGEDEERDRIRQAGQGDELRLYLESIGLVASETNRRATALRRRPRPAWQRALLRGVHASPTLSSAHRRLRTWGR